LTPAYDVASMRPGITGLLALMTPRARLYELTDTGRREIAELDGFPQCNSGDGGTATCLVRQRSRTEIWTLADTGAPSWAGSVPFGAITLASIGPDGHVTAVVGGNVTIIDPVAHRITGVTLPADTGYSTEAHSGAGFVSVLRRSVGVSTVIVYRIQ
jgi:hypothetical protein